MKRLTPIKAIRAKCLECCCGQAKEVRECEIKKCALYPYRMGHRPKDEEIHAGVLEEEKSVCKVGVFSQESKN